MNIPAFDVTDLFIGPRFGSRSADEEGEGTGDNDVRKGQASVVAGEVQFVARVRMKAKRGARRQIGRAHV